MGLFCKVCSAGLVASLFVPLLDAYGLSRKFIRYYIFPGNIPDIFLGMFYGNLLIDQTERHRTFNIYYSRDPYRGGFWDLEREVFKDDPGFKQYEDFKKGMPINVGHLGIIWQMS